MLTLQIRTTKAVEKMTRKVSIDLENDDIQNEEEDDEEEEKK